MKAEQIGIFFAATNESAPCNGFFACVSYSYAIITQLLRNYYAIITQLLRNYYAESVIIEL